MLIRKSDRNVAKFTRKDNIEANIVYCVIYRGLRAETPSFGCAGDGDGYQMIAIEKLCNMTEAWDIVWCREDG